MTECKIEASKVVANIYAFAKAKNIKIGDLEQAAGVSTGYLSRLNREGNTTMPSVEMLFGISKKLNISIETLLSADTSGMTKGEIYLLNFLEKVIEDTTEEDLEWNAESKSELEKVGGSVEGGADHPLFKARYMAMPLSDSMYVDTYYNSLYSDAVVEIAGDCFNTKLPYANAKLYLMHVVYTKELGDKTIKPHDEIEVYIVKNGEPEALCRTYRMNMALKKAISKLYSTISEISEHAGVSKGTRYLLDCYMNSTEEIPF